MILRAAALQFLSAAALGLLSAVACVAALPEGSAQDAALHKGSPGRAAPGDNDASAPEASPDGSPPPCLHGALEDPHRGFVRCLEPGEVDAGWLPPAPQPDAPPGGNGDAGAADASPPESIPPSAPATPPLVEIGAPVFENGEVPSVPKMMKGILGKVGRCVADHGGLVGTAGSLKVQFLVRSRGRAEGVEIERAKGVSDAASACVRLLLKNKAIGSPTADPVGVTVTFSFKPTSK